MAVSSRIGVPQGGKISWFNDAGTASGISAATNPGISTYNQQTLGGYWLVHMPNGRQAVLKQIDIGPAPWTNRNYDFSTPALGHLGYSAGNFPTDAHINATYLGKQVPGQYQHMVLGRGGSAVPTMGLKGPKSQAPTMGLKGSKGLTVPVTNATQGFDQAGYDAARKRALAGQFVQQLSASNPWGGPSGGLGNLFSAGLLTTSAPNPTDYITTGQKTTNVSLGQGTAPAQPTGQTGRGRQPAASTSNMPKGVGSFGGKPVANWIVPILQYAKAHGWTGSVNSGFRSFADQQRIYNSGVRPAAVPGTSRHEGSTFPRGAVDVSNAAQLSSILARSPYAKVLQWAGARDPVHFSHQYGGSY